MDCRAARRYLRPDIDFTAMALCERFPSSTLYQFFPKIAGNLLGNLTGIVYVLYFLAVTTLTLIMFQVVIGKWILLKTPKWVTFLLLLIPGIYLARESVRTTARFFGLASLLFVVLVPAVFYAFRFLNLTYLLPVLNVDVSSILEGTLGVWISFLGFEAMLLLYPFVEGKGSGKLKAISAANLFVTLLYTLMTVAALVTFSPEQLAYVPEPILFMLKGFSTRVISRLDILFLSVWYVKVVTTFTAYLHLTAHGFGYLFHNNRHTKAVPYVALISFILALFPISPSLLEEINRGTIRFSFLFVAALPLLFLLLSLLFKKKEVPQS